MAFPRIQIKQENVSEISTPNVNQPTKDVHLKPNIPHAHNEQQEDIKNIEVSPTVLIDPATVNQNSIPKKESVKTCQTNKIPNSRPKTLHNPPYSFATGSPKTTALQSVLNDIFVLYKEYKNIDNNPIEEEINKLRAKNNLPLLKTTDPPISADDSDFAEGSEDEIDFKNSETSFERGMEFNNKNNSSQQNGGRRLQNVEEDEDSDRLIIDESDDESTDKPEYVHVENYYLENKYVKTTIPFHDTSVMNSDNNQIKCPACARNFPSPHLKCHITPYSIEVHTAALAQTSLENIEFSKQTSLENSDYLNNLEINKVFSPGEEMLNCPHCNFVYTKTDLQRHSRDALFKKSRCVSVFSCVHCDFSCADLGDYKNHVSKNHSKRLKIQNSPSEVDIVEID